MQGKVCLITGANSGIGRETARELARRGATVVMCARDRGRGQEAVDDVKQSTGSDAVTLLELDLASFASIRAAVARFTASHERLDVLINNAGLVLGDRRMTAEGFESTFGVNHLGHFLWTTLLLDLIKRSAPARIINLASEAHRMSRGLDMDDLMFERRSYNGWRAYGDSKLANILFTSELARRLEGTGVVVHAVHPGVVGTGFGRDGDVGGVVGWLIKLAGPLLLTSAKGARTSIHVATSDEAGERTGLYWAKSRTKRPTRFAQDDEAARRLWERSEALVAEAAA
ncbi:MAG: SDR family oxidoreductase [Myxococcales bacterium]|nr:SDR family oxidoreductase [Myxococcales bacterium]MCB9750861.1 SDR family oxidoreductase [Myxococcales bacterium]